MLEAISIILYVEQMCWVRQKGLAQTIHYISEKPAADGQKEVLLLQNVLCKLLSTALKADSIVF